MTSRGLLQGQKQSETIYFLGTLEKPLVIDFDAAQKLVEE